MVKDCPGCRNENEFCIEHQKHEKEVYENSPHPRDSQMYRMAIHDARMEDLRDE